MESDRLLLSLGKKRQNVLRNVHPVLSPIPPAPKPKDSQQKKKEEKIWNRLNRDGHILGDALTNQYGGEARKVAYINYSERNPWPEEEPKLIEKVMANRRRDRSFHIDNQAEYIRQLADERERLLNEQKAVAKKKIEMVGERRPKSRESVILPPSHFASWDVNEFPPPLADPPSKVQSVDSVIRHEKVMLPAHEAAYMKRKKAFDLEYWSKHTAYDGRWGPNSYAGWQMEDYNMIRGLVEQFVENFLDEYFFENPYRGLDHLMQKRLHEEDLREREKRWTWLAETLAVQLIQEELVLEVTSKMAESVAYEFLNMFSYINNQTNYNYMQLSEIVATGDNDGRPPSDPAYNVITKGYFQVQGDRDKYRHSMWNHTQHLTLLNNQFASDEGPSEDVDVEILDFHHITPLHFRPENPIIYTTSRQVKQRSNRLFEYRKQEIQHWKNMTVSVQNLPISAKCNGVYSTQVSPNHSILAIGTYHGDIMLWDMRVEPFRPLRAVQNLGKDDDPVVDIAWSLDGTRLATVNSTGVFRLWSLVSPGLDKKEVSGLGLPADSRGLVPESLKLMLELDMDNHDFRFQRGTLAQAMAGDGQTSLGPSLIAFHPSLSMIGQQHHVCISLDNGDVLKCNMEEQFYDSTTQPLTPATYEKETPKILHPKVTNNETVIGQGIPAELFRIHRGPIFWMGFVHNSQDLITLDYKGFINKWSYKEEHLTGYDWFQPETRYKLDMTKMMYTPVPNTGSLVFSSSRDNNQGRTRQDINKKRELVEEQLVAAPMADPWHVDIQPDRNVITYIIPPAGTIADTGAPFHIVDRELGTFELKQYATRIYTPAKLKASRLLSVSQTPDGRELLILLLFPEAPPKSATLMVLRLDLATMKLVDWRRDIGIESDALYLQCLEQDVVSMAVTRMLGPTGSYYLFLNIAGEITGVSVNTGQKVFLVQGPQSNFAFDGITVDNKVLGISSTSQVLTAGFEDKYYIIFYTIDATNKNAQNRLNIVKLVDDNSHEQSLATWTAYNNWQTEPSIPLPPIEQQVVPVAFELDDMVHPEVFARQLILDMMDEHIEKRHGSYSDKEIEEQEQQDSINNYLALKARLAPHNDDDYDPALIPSRASDEPLTSARPPGSAVSRGSALPPSRNTLRDL